MLFCYHRCKIINVKEKYLAFEMILHTISQANHLKKNVNSSSVVFESAKVINLQSWDYQTQPLFSFHLVSSKSSYAMSFLTQIFAKRAMKKGVSGFVLLNQMQTLTLRFKKACYNGKVKMRGIVRKNDSIELKLHKSHVQFSKIQALGLIFGCKNIVESVLTRFLQNLWGHSKENNFQLSVTV